MVHRCQFACWDESRVAIYSGCYTLWLKEKIRQSLQADFETKMSTHNLESLFEPSSMAIIGASENPSSIGSIIWQNMYSSGFAGEIHAINPKYELLSGQPCYARVGDLPQAPELAVICTPANTVVGLVQELADCGTKAVIIMSAGLSEQQTQAVLDAAKPEMMRLLGPNSIGILTPHHGLNASLAQRGVRSGQLAFVSQSRALVTAMLDWAETRQIGFSKFVSLGEHADIDYGDLLDYLASDSQTRAILLHMASIDHPRKFMSAARAASRNKPVIVIKAGRSEAGKQAAATHTGALIRANAIFDAAVARAGMLRVDTLEQLFSAAELLTRFRGMVQGKMTILANGGGLAVMAADAAAKHEVSASVLSDAFVQDLDDILLSSWKGTNPIILDGDAPVQDYVQALKSWLRHRSPEDMLLFIQAPTARVPSTDIARALLPILAPKGSARLPVISAWVGGPAVAQARALFAQAGLACYEFPDQAVAAIAMLQTHARNQAELTQAPSLEAADAYTTYTADTVHALIRNVLIEKREVLTEPETKQICKTYGIPVVATHSVPADPELAAEQAKRIGFPVALKILSKDIVHKSAAGGVALHLNDAADVRNAAKAMLSRFSSKQPAAHIDGFTVQPMVYRPHSQELIVGASIDPSFGPVILFGQGGTAVEVLRDHAIALPPVNEPLALSLIRRTRIARLLAGYGEVPAANIQAIVATLQAISRMLADIPEIAELDINPLLADETGAVVLDASMRISATCPAGARHFSIAPYPEHLIETMSWQDKKLTLRPIRPEDEEQHRYFYDSLDMKDIYQRMFQSKRSLSREELARMVQIDYTREMAFIATVRKPNWQEETLGVARTITAPDNSQAEFSIILRPDCKRGGLGRILMKKLISYHRDQKTHILMGYTMQDNYGMRALARSLGFSDHIFAEDTELRYLELVLN